MHSPWATPRILVPAVIVVAVILVAVADLKFRSRGTVPTDLPTPTAPPPTPAGRTIAVCRGDQISLQIQKTIDTFHQALIARFLDAGLNERVAMMLTEIESPDVVPLSHQDRPAFLLISEMLALCRTQQPRYAEMNWKDLEERAGRLKNYPTVGRLADKILAWAQSEGAAVARLAEGKDLIRAGKLEEGFASFAMIGNDSVHSKEAAQQLLELKTLLTERTERESGEKSQIGDFQGALDEIDRVLNLFEGKYADAVVALHPLRKECEKNLKYQLLVQEAEIILTQKRFEDAEVKLASIDLGAPSAVLARVEKLKESIDVQRTMTLANERYRAGDGKAALQILQNSTDPDLIQLRTKIQKVVEATTAAQQATANQHFDEAKRYWAEVYELEPDEKNRYHQACCRETAGPSECGLAADREYDKGSEAQQAEQFGDARAHYEEAMKLMPDYDKSLMAIRAFCRNAQKQFNFDKIAFTKGTLTLEVILPKFENVLAFLRPSDAGVYTLYKEAIEKLKATGKF